MQWGDTGDEERLAVIRERLEKGERRSAAKFAADIANRARNDEQMREDARTLAELVHILADALIAAGDVHAGRGRPKGRDDNGLADFLAWHAVAGEYRPTVTAGEIANGRDVPSHDAAALLWWAYIGPESHRNHAPKDLRSGAGDYLRFVEATRAKLEAILADTTHECHAHYASLLQKVAIEVTNGAGAGDVDAKGFRTRLRARMVGELERYGVTDAKFRRMLTRVRGNKPAQ